MASVSQGFSINNRKDYNMLILYFKNFLLEINRGRQVIQLGFYLVLDINNGYTGNDRTLVSFFPEFTLFNTLT